LVNIHEKASDLKVKIGKKEYLFRIEKFDKGLPDDERTDLIIKSIYENISSNIEKFIDQYGKEKIITSRKYPYAIYHGRVNLHIYEQIRNLVRESKALEDKIKNQQQLKIDNLNGKRETTKLMNEYNAKLEETHEKIDEVKNDELNKYLNKEKMLFSTYLDNELISLYSYSDRDIEDFVTTEKELPPVIFDFDTLRSISKIYDLYELIAESSTMLKKVTKLLTDNISYLENIIGTKNSIRISIKNLDETLPIELMGSGFVSLVELIFMVSFAQKGVVLLEEPEISLHPGFMEILAEGLIKNSKDTQLFISTHSLDLINQILVKGKENKILDQIQVITMQRIKDSAEIDIKSLDGNDAIEKLHELSIDLREF